MPSELANVAPTEFGLVGLVLLVVWKLLGVAEKMIMSKRNGHSDHPSGLSRLACQVDPAHFHRIIEIHENTEELKTQMSQGSMSCQWRDRDEVRDYLEIAKQQLAATKEQTRELQLTRTALIRMQALQKVDE